MSDPAEADHWRLNGIRIVKAGELDANTAQTPGMNRAAAITHATAGAQKIWAGTVSIHPDAKTGAHHHGHLESVIYVVKGKARMRWGDKLQYVAEAEAGDFIFVPPYVPHQEINAADDQSLECVLVRSDQEPVVVNLDIDPVENPSRCAGSTPTTRNDPGKTRTAAGGSPGGRFACGRRGAGGPGPGPGRPWGGRGARRPQRRAIFDSRGSMAEKSRPLPSSPTNAS